MTATMLPPATTYAPARAGPTTSFDLYVRGEIPRCLQGALVVATSRRAKRRERFSRWHDSTADLIRLDCYPGRPGRVRATVLASDPLAGDLDDGWGDPLRDPPALRGTPRYGYVTQPNHATNSRGRSLWATNLLYGAPLEVDLATWTPVRVLRYLQPDELRPRVSTTAHFAWTDDGRHAYFAQSLLASGAPGRPVETSGLHLVRLDLGTGNARLWPLDPPPEDADPASANFHSAFAYRQDGAVHVGFLRTGAVVDDLAPRAEGNGALRPMPPAAVWIVRVDPGAARQQATLLPGLEDHRGFALSHLAVDTSGGEGFVLFANCKQADVGRETRGANVYGQAPETIAEHYSGMITEPLDYGTVFRYESRGGRFSLRTFERPYDPSATSLGHTWLPINLELNSTGERVFATFAGLRPRLVSRHIAGAYPGRVADFGGLRYVPPLLLRLDAATLEPDRDRRRGYLSYAESVAVALAGDAAEEVVCTFSPEHGLRVYDAGDLSRMLAHAVSVRLMHWSDTHFRPEPAHLEFVPR